MSNEQVKQVGILLAIWRNDTDGEDNWQWWEYKYVAEKIVAALTPTPQVVDRNGYPPVPASLAVEFASGGDATEHWHRYCDDHGIRMQADPGRDIERRALGNAIDLIGKITGRARDEIQDAKAGASYAAQVNNGGALMAQQTREDAWTTVLGIIQRATGVGEAEA